MNQDLVQCSDGIVSKYKSVINYYTRVRFVVNLFKKSSFIAIFAHWLFIR